MVKFLFLATNQILVAISQVHMHPDTQSKTFFIQSNILHPDDQGNKFAMRKERERGEQILK